MTIFWCRTDPWLATPHVAEYFCEREGILTQDFFCIEELVPHAAGRFLLCMGFRQYRPDCGLPPVHQIPGGKPYFLGGKPAFSISHAGAVAVCVISEDEIGIDVEQITDVEPSLLSILRPEELACFRRSPKSEQARIFHRLWTQKESLIKARGGVLADIFDQESVITPDLLWKDCLDGFFLRSLSFPEAGYILSVSAKAEESAVITRLELPRGIDQLSECLHWDTA